LAGGGTVWRIGRALAAAQGEYQPLKFNQSNSYFNSKYADLAAIIEAHPAGAGGAWPGRGAVTPGSCNKRVPLR
jgi:hypothetical protein